MLRRARNAKIVAILGIATSTGDHIWRLFEAGVDVFYGSHQVHGQNYNSVRGVETEIGRLIGAFTMEVGAVDHRDKLVAEACQMTTDAFFAASGTMPSTM